MSQMCFAKLNLRRIAANLSAEQGTNVTADEASVWLEKNGFQRLDDGWIAEAAVIAELAEDEITTATSLFPIPMAAGAGDENWQTPPYVLTPERLQQLALMPRYDECMIPQLLCGTATRKVRQDIRRIVRRALKSRSWKTALEGETFVHIDTIPGFLMTTANQSRTGQENVFLYLLTEELTTQAFDRLERKEFYEILRDLRVTGTKEFWFSLCMTVGPFQWLPVMPPSYEDDLRDAAKQCFFNIMMWWPQFCARDDRFAAYRSFGWPLWGLPQEFALLFKWPVNWDYLRSVNAATAGARYWKLWCEGEGKPASNVTSIWVE